MNTKFEKDFLTIAEVQEYLSLSKSAAYALIHRKDFPVARFGGSIRIPSAAFTAWVQQNMYIPKALNISVA